MGKRLDEFKTEDTAFSSYKGAMCRFHLSFLVFSFSPQWKQISLLPFSPPPSSSVSLECSLPFNPGSVFCVPLKAFLYLLVSLKSGKKQVKVFCSVD